MGAFTVLLRCVEAREGQRVSFYLANMHHSITHTTAVVAVARQQQPEYRNDQHEKSAGRKYCVAAIDFETTEKTDDPFGD